MLLENLGSGSRAVVVSHQSWATTILTALASYNIIIAEKKRPIISEATPTHHPSIARFLEKKGVSEDLYPIFTDFPFKQGQEPIIVHSVGKDLSEYHKYLRENLFAVRVVFTHANKGLSTILRFPVIRLVSIKGKVFKVQESTTRKHYVIEINEEGLNKISYSGKSFTGKAYEILLDAMSNFGEITVKDAVYILRGNMGIDNRLAREIIGRLVEERKIRIKKGVVMLA
jgi:hypothetical protein